MELYFSTVIRNAPPLAGGELVRLDWARKQVLARHPVAATDPVLDDPNPRGNTRGGRGVAFHGDEVLVCSYHSLLTFDRALLPRRRLSHPLMVGLHEVSPGGPHSLWLSCTATDAVLEVDLASGALLQDLWPREMPGLQQALGVKPLDVDKRADNRGLWLGSDHLKSDSHLHLNAVTARGSEVFALFSFFGAICDLRRGEVVVRDERIVKGHNLVFDDAGLAWVNDTQGRRLFAFDLARRECVREIDLLALAPVARLRRRHDRVFALKSRLHRRGWLAAFPPRPLFVRGLAVSDSSIFVGLSPTTILELDRRTGALRDHYQDTRDVSVCVHGLALAPD